MNKDVRARWIEELESGEYPDREMTFLSKMYHCQQVGVDTITIEPSTEDGGGIYFTAWDGNRAEVDLSRDDALSLAWDIIEHFEDGTRPKPVIKVGDYVKSVGGYVGRVLDIRDAFNGKVIEVQQPDARHIWNYEYCSRVTEQEFIDYHQQSIAEITNMKV